MIIYVVLYWLLFPKDWDKFLFIYIYIQHESIKKLDVTREKADSQIIVKCSPNHDFYDSVPQSWLGHVLC